MEEGIIIYCGEWDLNMEGFHSEDAFLANSVMELDLFTLSPNSGRFIPTSYDMIYVQWVHKLYVVETHRWCLVDPLSSNTEGERG